jgi:hypothetical protein
MNDFYLLSMRVEQQQPWNNASSGTALASIGFRLIAYAH